MSGSHSVGGGGDSSVERSSGAPDSPQGGGDYPDKDVPGGDLEVGEGTFTDQETPQEKRGESPDLRGPGDRGEYTDSDHIEEHRPAPAQGGYTSKDTDRSSNDQAEEHPHG